MIAIRACFLTFLINFSDGASIRSTNDTLEIFKDDISKVGGAIENLTFDVLRNILENPNEEIVRDVNEEEVKPRQIRSTSDSEEFLNLCEKRCKEEYSKTRNLETQHIKDLKNEVQRLKELVHLLQNQQKIINVLNEEAENNNNKTKTEIREKSEDETVPNSEQLAMIKFDLKEAIKSLNETKEFLNFQKKKDAIMAQELIQQQEEIRKLKNLVNSIIIDKNIPKHLERAAKDEELEENQSNSTRSSEFSEIRKFLKNLHDEDDNDDLDEIRSKILQLEKQLEKKKKQEDLAKELKLLEASLAEKNTPNDLLKQLMKALRQTELQNRSDDPKISNLEDLQKAINNLRPKENDDSVQFQAMLDKLINRPTPNQRPSSQITITPQQMSELSKKLPPHNYPYICIVDDGAGKSNGYRAPVNSRNFQFYPPAPVDYSNQKGQFFPGPAPQQNYYPQANSNGSGGEKATNYQSENDSNNQRYQEDLKAQIDGLQAAIDNLNRPEYTQKPEDKAIIDDLERQITDLRDLINHGNYQQNRPKRSTDDNQVEDSTELIQQMKNLVGKILDNNEEKNLNFTEIQNKIDVLKNQLDSENKERASGYGQQDTNPNLYPSQIMNFPFSSVKSSKNDFFTDIVSKILDKLIAIIPVVIQKLFNFSIDELTKNDYQDYDIQVLFKNLGIFAYLPVILLRVLKGVSAFMNMLRKNSFFKNFIMPAVILATVAGSVLFLIWWLQPDDTQYQNNYVNYDPNYSTKSPVSPNYPVYSKNYYNK